MAKNLFMIPGPVEVDPEVLLKMSSPMVAHYGAEWTNFYDDTQNMIKEIMGTQNDLFLHVGSGHSALDAVIGSIVEEGKQILVLSNGFFGERIAEIVEDYRGNAVEFKADWGEAIDPQTFEKYLAENHSRFKTVMMVHTETSTGVTNPVYELNKIAKKYGLLTFVDAVCSAGVTELKMDEWGIDLCVTASQKGLGAPPGLAVICVNERAWEVMENRVREPIGWYLNLLKMKEFHEKQREWQPYGITMAVSNVKALNRALKDIKEEGLENRITRHEEISKYFRERIRKLGLDILASEKVASNPVSVIENPEGYSSEGLIKLFKEKYNIRIANGLGKFAGNYVRVGHMNLGASKNSVLPVINAFDELCDR